MYISLTLEREREREKEREGERERGRERFALPAKKNLFAFCTICQFFSWMPHWKDETVIFAILSMCQGEVWVEIAFIVEFILRRYYDFKIWVSFNLLLGCLLIMLHN